jgi:PAS domain S-box-containing protein
MQTNPRLFSKILLPSMVAVLLFLVAIYFFVIPNYRENLMNGKRETIRELTSTAWSVMHKLDLMVNEDLALDKAKKEAAIIISDMRWGLEMKDYFWITDTIPRMVMHPYRPSMNGMDLSDFKDPLGKNFFVDIVKIVKADGDGYIDYKWQWKDDSLTVVSKLSYVKAYEPWGWIVGTGIYIDDVNREIETLTRRLVWISVLITILIGTIITYLARRNYIAENERQKTQERLRDSMQRYKKLVEASTDGVLMMMDDEIVYCNPYLLNLLGYTQDEFDQHDTQFYNTLDCFLQLVSSSIEEGEGSKHPEIAMEQKITKKNGLAVDVVVNRSKFDIGGKQGYIYAVKDVSKHKDVERELDLSMEKFKSIAGLMNIGIFRCTLGRQSRFIEINPKVLTLLGYNTEFELKDTKVQDLFDMVEERKEVIRAINEGTVIKDRLLRLKRADGSVLPALVSLFPVADAHDKMVFCDGMIIDAYDHLCRDSDFDKSTQTIHLSANVLLRPINEFMLSAPHCDMKLTVGSASKILTRTKADILLVLDSSNSIVGMITHSDISRRVVAVDNSSSIPVSEIMSAPVIAVNEENMVMDAFTLMVQNRVSYIVVKTNEVGKYYYISLLSLSELRKDTPEYIINSIQNTETTYEISQIMGQMPRLIKSLIESGTGVATTGKLISKITDSITEKLISMSIAELGQPPAPFVFITLGSEGRKEQTLATDQDNAIVYNPYDEENDEVCKKYFLELGGRICNSLSKVGYPLCKGGVMAMNAEWCLSLKSWEKTIRDWVTTPNPQEILNTSIFFDFRPVYGDFELANRLQKFCLNALKDQNIFFYNLAQTTINLKVNTPDSSKDGEEYDIKMPILAIISIARLWVLKFGIGERNTSERLLALNTLGVLSNSLRDEFDQAYRFLTLIRVKNQLKQIEANKEPSNKIDVKSFSDIEKLTIKKIVSTISDHQGRIGIDFRVG